MKNQKNPSPLELKWERVPRDALWYGGTVILGAIEVLNNKTNVTEWFYYKLAINVDEGGICLYELTEDDSVDFSAWSIEDFDYIAVIGGLGWTG